jgi:hypothetical protein
MSVSLNVGAGASPIGSLLFFYIFFVVLLIFLFNGLWGIYQSHLREMPSPLSAVLLGIPETINLFDNIEAILQVKNCGKLHLKKVHVVCGNTWTVSLKPQVHIDIPIRLDTLYAGRHQLKAHITCKQWELHIFCMYRVFQRKLSQKEKYLKVLGLKPGATSREIRKARNKLAKKYHPDTGNGHEEKMKEINEAYNNLMAS